MFTPVFLNDAITATRGQSAANTTSPIRAIIDAIVASFGVVAIAIDNAIAAVGPERALRGAAIVKVIAVACAVIAGLSVVHLNVAVAAEWGQHAAWSAGRGPGCPIDVRIDAVVTLLMRTLQDAIATPGPEGTFRSALVVAIRL